MEQTKNEDRAEELRRERRGLVRADRALFRELGERVASGQSTADLRARRRELRESHEDLTAGLMHLEAMHA